MRYRRTFFTALVAVSLVTPGAAGADDGSYGGTLLLSTPTGHEVSTPCFLTTDPKRIVDSVERGAECSAKAGGVTTAGSLTASCNGSYNWPYNQSFATSSINGTANDQNATLIRVWCFVDATGPAGPVVHYTFGQASRPAANGAFSVNTSSVAKIPPPPVANVTMLRCIAWSNSSGWLNPC